MCATADSAQSQINSVSHHHRICKKDRPWPVFFCIHKMYMFDSTKRLIEIGDQIFHALDSDTQTNKVV